MQKKRGEVENGGVEFTVWALMPPGTIVPLREGTVPDVYTIPLEVHAPLAGSGLVWKDVLGEMRVTYTRLVLGCRGR